ncbi:tetraspanin 36 [Salarias fasciatus]|uniref:Tetraspanin n=1 Tax=Salarias fasciatus TaxID=181472 RepID=A0A672JEP3_SALFA|nr:tetraspanin-36-like [Salarias fasciatus]
MDCGIATSKSILLFLSLVFWAAGAALAYVGAYVIKSYGSFENFIQDKYTLVPAAIIIGISVVMFIIGLVGCCSTIRESKLGLSFFFCIIMVIFAAEVTALVFNFIYQNRLGQGIDRSMNDVFNKYGDGEATAAVDILQAELKCCGVSNYTSWTNTSWFRQHNNTVPLSCCKEKNSTCTGSLSQPDLLYQEGCEVSLVRFLHDVLRYAMLVVLGFAIIKFFGMLSVCVITCRSDRTGYEPLYA